MEEPKTIVIAGACSDIGQCLVKRLSQKYLNLILLDQSMSKLEELKNSLEKSDAYLTLNALDWNNKEELDNIFENIYDEFGNINTLVSLLDRCYFSPSGSTDSAVECADMININYLANLALVSNTLPVMLQEDQGNIIALGERMLSLNDFSKGYIASKAALSSYWRELQRDCFSYNVQLALVRFNDPTIFRPINKENKIKYIAQNQPALLEQIANMLDAIIFQIHGSKINSISLG